MRTAKAPHVALLLALAGCTRPSLPSRGGGAAPRTATKDALAVTDDREACGPCHPEIMAEWIESAHRSAWSDPVFVAGYAVDRQPECRRCHAPLNEGDVDPSPSSVAARNGIACRSCHAREGRIAGPAGARWHGGPVEPTWGRGEACRGCHEFSFPPAIPPRPVVFDPREPMQRTYTEWVESGVTSTCQECHMPWRVGGRGQRYRSHRMLGIDDPALMREAVRVRVRATATDQETSIEVDIDADAIGHAFPTGDMFRVAELRLSPVGQDGPVRSIVMQRGFGPVIRPDEDGRPRARLAETRDTRPRPGRPLRRRTRLAGRHAAVQWRLVHLRMRTEQARVQGLLDVNERLVAEGIVQVEQLTTSRVP